MPRGPINLHRGLGDDELPWRYRRRHDRLDIEDYDPSEHLLEIDDYWDPWYEVGALDLQLHRIWQDIVNLGFSTRPATDREPAPRPAIAPDELGTALYQHLQRVARAEPIRPPGEVLAASRDPELRRWFEQRRGPALTLVVLEPFWIRSLASWAGSATGDLDAFGRSLVDHLLVRYPVPEPLYRPWRSTEPPPLKWVSWLVLIAQGASLHRAAPRFGWSVSTKVAQVFAAITDDMAPLDAVMWAEIMHLGGSPTELARIRRHPGFVFDPTGPDESHVSIDGVDGTLQSLDEVRSRLDPTYRPRLAPDAAFRGFWRSTVDWLARHRDALTDETSDLILDWALHRHTEDRARDVAATDAFSWSGRTPAAALEHARVYRATIDGTWRARLAPLFWPARGWNWEHDDGGQRWSIVELTSAMELAEESREMHHCVGSYAYRCVQGTSAIFSVTCNDLRRFTVEIDPRSRQCVQARGSRNRSCNDEENTVLRRWLDDLVVKSTGAT